MSVGDFDFVAQIAHYFGDMDELGQARPTIRRAKRAGGNLEVFIENTKEIQINLVREARQDFFGAPGASWTSVSLPE